MKANLKNGIDKVMNDFTNISDTIFYHLGREDSILKRS